MQALDIDIKAADGSAMYTKHPKEDLAAIHLSLPLNHALMFTRVSGLATDAVMAKLEIHPTDEMFTWGYPDCTPSSSQYYPILRRGVVASRVAAGENFLLDLPAIGGNSGGMVYFEYVNRYYANVIHNDEVYKYIAGVLTHSLNGLGGQPLGVSRIVPARYIEEILKSLPPR